MLLARWRIVETQKPYCASYLQSSEEILFEKSTARCQTYQTQIIQMMMVVETARSQVQQAVHAASFVIVQWIARK